MFSLRCRSGLAVVEKLMGELCGIGWSSLRGCFDCGMLARHDRRLEHHGYACEGSVDSEKRGTCSLSRFGDYYEALAFLFKEIRCSTKGMLIYL